MSDKQVDYAKSVVIRRIDKRLDDIERGISNGRLKPGEETMEKTIDMLKRFQRMSAREILDNLK